MFILCGFFLAGLQKFDLIFTCLTIFTVSIYFIFIFKPDLLSYLTNPFIGKLGVSSYSVYLIHYHVGSACIIMYNEYIGKESYITLFLLVVLFFLFGLFSYKYLERPISNQLRKILFKKRVEKPNEIQELAKVK